MTMKKLKKFLLAAVLMWAAFLMQGKPTEAATVGTGQVMLAGTTGVHSTILRDEDPGTGTGVGVNGSSGVSELDKAATRTNTLINWICGWIGGIMALFGFIWAAMNQAGHNTDSRNMGIIVAAVGIVIAFAPRIVNFILGR